MFFLTTGMLAAFPADFLFPLAALTQILGS
jgi:ABC-type anion transport system duplicated permease subunit